MSEITVRSAVASDLESLVALETRAMHFPKGHRVREWFRDDFPADHRDHFVVAEHEGKAVAAAALLPQTILYRGVPLKAAVWDAVVTDEGYRRQGLCRRLFQALEAKAATDLMLVQGLTWLYRRFGYYPALRNHGGLDSGGWTVRAEDFPISPLSARPATPEDVPCLLRLQDLANERYIVAAPFTEAYWRYLLRPDRTVAGPGERGLNRWQEWHVIESQGRPVGSYMHDPWDCANLGSLEIVAGETSWREAGAAAIGGTAAFAGKDEVRVVLPDGHPLYAAFPRSFERRFRAYGDIAARIGDPVAFLRKVESALEGMMARSAMAGWSGEVSISRIKDGVRLRLEAGMLVEIAPWQGERADAARVRLMPGRFEALALGYRSIEEILAEDADCAADPEAEAVLAALFPRGDSLFRSF